MKIFAFNKTSFASLFIQNIKSHNSCSENKIFWQIFINKENIFLDTKDFYLIHNFIDKLFVIYNFLFYLVTIKHIKDKVFS